MLGQMSEVEKKSLKRTKTHNPNKISRMQTKLKLESKEIDDRRWFSRVMDKISGLDYQGYLVQKKTIAIARESQ